MTPFLERLVEVWRNLSESLTRSSWLSATWPVHLVSSFQAEVCQASWRWVGCTRIQARWARQLRHLEESMPQSRQLTLAWKAPCFQHSSMSFAGGTWWLTRIALPAAIYCLYEIGSYCRMNLGPCTHSSQYGSVRRWTMSLRSTWRCQSQPTALGSSTPASTSSCLSWISSLS